LNDLLITKSDYNCSSIVTTGILLSIKKVGDGAEEPEETIYFPAFSKELTLG